MQTQALESHFADMPIGAHPKTQTEQRAVTLDRIFQRLQRQWQHFRFVGGAEPASHALYRPGLDRGVARHRQRRSRSLQRIELQHAECRQWAHVVRPQQMHQRVGQLRQLVV